MNANQLSFVVQSVLSLVVLTFILSAWWPAQRTDIFRQQMFALRDELFDYALDGHISFEHPAYRLLRDLMNALIRYAHNLTPYRTLLLFLRWKGTTILPSEDWSVQWERAMKRVDGAETSTNLREFHSRTVVLVTSLLVLSPGVVVTVLPFLALAIIVYPPWVTLRDIYVGIREWIPLAIIEREAVNS